MMIESKLAILPSSRMISDCSPSIATRSFSSMWRVKHLLDQPTALTPISSSYFSFTQFSQNQTDFILPSQFGIASLPRSSRMLNHRNENDSTGRQAIEPSLVVKRLNLSSKLFVTTPRTNSSLP